MIKKTITINDIEIAYYTNSVESGKTILFIHGNSMNGLSFSDQFDEPLLAKYKMIALDLPGHGASAPAPKPEETYNLIGYSNLLVALINSLALNNVILVGHSLGGHIAIETTELSAEILGVVVFGTPPIGIPPAMEKMFLPNPAIAYAFTGELSQSEAETLASSFSKTENNFSANILQTDPNARAFMGASVDEAKFRNERGICAKMKVPLAILHGAEDILVNLDYFSGIDLPTLWNNKVHVIENCGHVPQVEKPKEFNQTLLRFLNSFL